MSLKKSIELLNVMARILVVQKIRSNFKYVWKCRLCKHVQGCWVQGVAVSFNPSMPPFSNCDRNSKSSHKQQCQDRTTGCWLYVNPFPLVRDPKIILIQKKRKKKKNTGVIKRKEILLLRKSIKIPIVKRQDFYFNMSSFCIFFLIHKRSNNLMIHTHIYIMQLSCSLSWLWAPVVYCITCNLPDPHSLCDYATVPGCASGYM